MDIFDKVNEFISNLFGIKGPYVKLVVSTIVVILFFKILEKIITYIVLKIGHKNNKFRFNFRRIYSLVNTVLIILSIIFIWEDFIIKFIYLFSFVTAAVAYSLRDIIINFFCGIYIKISKPFQVEDRIMVDNYIGDVVNISTLSFEILEVNLENFQSTGAIVHVPNSKVFSSTVKNYVKVFKYIWNEIEVKIDLNSDIKHTKSELYRIVNNNEVLKKIPIKMAKELSRNDKYRIYYNKLEPIIYMDIKDKYISLYLRYLVHPKKNRNVESEIWNEIYKLNLNNEILLYSEK